MLKIIAKTFLGLILSGTGFFLAFYYLIEMENGMTFLILIPAIVLIIVGAYLLLRAGKSDATVTKKLNIVNKVSKDGLVNVLNKNSELTSEWAKTVEKRDRLKLLQISSAEEEQA